jgi:hypothetical protein
MVAALSVPKGEAPGEGKAGAGPTNAQITNQIAATKQLAELNAQLLTHSTHRLEVEQKIAAIEQLQGHALDATTKTKLLNAASAEDAKAGDRAGATAQRKAEEAAKKIAEAADRVAQTLDDGDKAMREAQGKLTQNIAARAAAEKAAIDDEAAKKSGEIEAQAAKIAADKDIGAAKKKQLLADLDIAKADEAAAAQAKKALIDRELEDEQRAAAMEYQRQVGAYATQILGDAQSMAGTSAERRQLALARLAIEQNLQQLALDEQQRKEKLAGTLTDAQAAAQQSLLRQQQGYQAQNTLNSTAGPGAQFQSGLNKSYGGDLTDQFQGAEVSGLEAFGSQLDDVILKTKTAKAAFHDWAMSVVKDLLMIGTKKLIELPLATALFGGGQNGTAGQGGQAMATAASATALAGLTSSATAAAVALQGLTAGMGVPGAAAAGTDPTANPGGFLAGVASILHFIPGFAGGTDDAPGGLSIVGEDGPELMNVPKGAKITPNNMLGAGVRPLSVAQSNYAPTFDLRGAVVTEDLMNQMNAMSQRHAAAAVVQAVNVSRSVVPNDMGRAQRAAFGR